MQTSASTRACPASRRGPVCTFICIAGIPSPERELNEGCSACSSRCTRLRCGQWTPGLVGAATTDFGRAAEGAQILRFLAGAGRLITFILRVIDGRGGVLAAELLAHGADL